MPRVTIRPDTYIYWTNTEDGIHDRSGVNALPLREGEALLLQSTELSLNPENYLLKMKVKGEDCIYPLPAELCKDRDALGVRVAELYTIQALASQQHFKHVGVHLIETDVLSTRADGHQVRGLRLGFDGSSHTLATGVTTAVKDSDNPAVCALAMYQSFMKANQREQGESRVIVRQRHGGEVWHEAWAVDLDRPPRFLISAPTAYNALERDSFTGIKAPWIEKDELIKQFNDDALHTDDWVAIPMDDRTHFHSLRTNRYMGYFNGWSSAPMNQRAHALFKALEHYDDAELNVAALTYGLPSGTERRSTENQIHQALNGAVVAQHIRRLEPARNLVPYGGVAFEYVVSPGAPRASGLIEYDRGTDTFSVHTVTMGTVATNFAPTRVVDHEIYVESLVSYIASVREDLGITSERERRSEDDLFAR